MWLRSQALVREAKLAGRLDYPGIVTIHEVFELGELVPVTMAYNFLGLAEGFLLAGGEEEAAVQGAGGLGQAFAAPPDTAPLAHRGFLEEGQEHIERHGEQDRPNHVPKSARPGPAPPEALAPAPGALLLRGGRWRSFCLPRPRRRAGGRFRRQDVERHCHALVAMRARDGLPDHLLGHLYAPRNATISVMPQSPGARVG